jgi:CHAT domain-containing protein/tetratricopeptide (TPR) repeat protein
MRTRLRFAGVASIALAFSTCARSPTGPVSFARELDTLELQSRVTEGRLWGQFRYAPWSGAERGRVALPSPDVTALAARAQQRFMEGAATIGDYGVAVAVAGDLSSGIEALESAARGSSRQAEWLTDLAALYLERQRALDVIRALDASARATLQDGTATAPLFSTGLALTRVHLLDQAAQTWRAYLLVERDPAWRREAERALSALANDAPAPSVDTPVRAVQLAPTQPEAVRVAFEQRILPAWLDDCAATRDASASGAAMVSVAQALFTATGDAFFRQIAEDRGRIRCGTSVASQYRRGMNAYAQARRKYETDDSTAAAVDFAVARRAFEGVSTPFVRVTDLYLAIADYYAGRPDTSAMQLERTRRAAASAGFRYVAARCSWMVGVIQTSQARYSDARDNYQRALDGFREMGDRQNAASVEALLATVYERLGEFPASWDARLESLQQLAVLSERRQHTALTGAARAALAQQLPGAARFFANAAVDVATRWGRPGAQSEALLLRARAERQLGDDSRALGSLSAARAALVAIADTAFRGIIESEVLLAEGETLAATDPAAAERAITALLPVLERTGTVQDRARAYLALGRAAARAGNAEGARVAFASGIDSLERQRKYLDSTDRVSAFDQTWQLFPELARLELARNNPAAVLGLWERARARTLAELMDTTDSPDLHAPTAGIPASVSVIYYAVMPDRVLSWSIESTGAAFHMDLMDEAQLEDAVSTLRRGIRGAGPAPSAAAKELYRVLLSPHADALRRHSTVVVVPDGALHELPFGTLTDPVTGRMLLEDHALIVAPSLRIFKALRRRVPAPVAIDSALLVAVPRASDNGTEMAALPYAGREVEAIRPLLRGADVLEGGTATRERFLALSADRSLVHFAGHAVVERDYPNLSRLLFSAPAGADGRLLINDLARARFTRLSLVVLSACETASGHVYRGEGPTTLARPFLAAGASTVIGSLWPVPDADTGAFFKLFYQRLVAGETPSSALRLAQLEAARRPDISGKAWSAFTAIGAW